MSERRHRQLWADSELARGQGHLEMSMKGPWREQDRPGKAQARSPKSTSREWV